MVSHSGISLSVTGEENCRKYTLRRSEQNRRRVKLAIAGVGALVALILSSIVYRLLHTDVRRHLWVSFALIGAAMISASILQELRRRVAEESLLVTRDVGVQIERVCFSGRQSSRFIDSEDIRSIFINEGITGWEIVYYLAFELVDSDKTGHTVLAFKLHPGIKVLKEVYNGVIRSMPRLRGASEKNL